MKAESYTPGHTQNASDFMAKRTLESHGSFFLPYLESGACVLDCGCGPGTITLGIARRAAPAIVVGIDFGQSQIDCAIAAASKQNVSNISFRTADVYALPFDDCSFDRIFSHALMEHLADPVRALGEMWPGAETGWDHRPLQSGLGRISPGAAVSGIVIRGGGLYHATVQEWR